MSVPADIMQLQTQGGTSSPQGPAAQPGAAKPSVPTPAAAPASSPTPQEGNKVLAETSVQTAVTMLMSALGAYQMGSEEYNDLLDCLKKLSRRFGSSPGQGLVPSQVMEMVRQIQSGSPQASPPGAAQ